MKKTLTEPTSAQRMAERIWLNYFNHYLFESATISETEYKLMTEKIAVRFSEKNRMGTIPHMDE